MKNKNKYVFVRLLLVTGLLPILLLSGCDGSSRDTSSVPAQ